MTESTRKRAVNTVGTVGRASCDLISRRSMITTVLILLAALVPPQIVSAEQHNWASFEMHGPSKWRHCPHPYVPFGSGGAAQIVRVRSVGCLTARKVVRAYLGHAYRYGKGRVRGFHCMFSGPPQLGTCRKGHRTIRFVSD
jgi:hypothetical protein